jgi:bifunctional non-homologous end joining protein LigD
VRFVDGVEWTDAMALKEYRAKRNFQKSPEPAGDDTVVAQRRTAGARTPRFFCVQKHLASSLHYDFRIEHNGVLLSWAVPKGPSLDPSDKRLAMHVEDHPIEYGEFEGVIPDGYGAGVVMLWDRGTWTPETDDVDAALKKGDLKMTLDGYKLKGSWVLVRTRGWSGGQRGAGAKDDGKSWLLIKHRDDWAGPIDITTFAPNSVKSEGTFRDILTAEAPDVWHSHRGATGDEDASLRKIVEKVVAYEQETAPAGEPDARPAAKAPGTPAAGKTAKAARAKTATARAASSRSAAASKRRPRTS